MAGASRPRSGYPARLETWIPQRRPGGGGKSGQVRPEVRDGVRPEFGRTGGEQAQNQIRSELRQPAVLGEILAHQGLHQRELEAVDCPPGGPVGIAE